MSHEEDADPAGNITQHLKAISAEGESGEAATCKDYLQVRQEGRRAVHRHPKHYSLPAMLVIGCKVSSVEMVQ